MQTARRVLIVAYDNVQILDIACPSGALDIANRFGANPRTGSTWERWAAARRTARRA